VLDSVIYYISINGCVCFNMPVEDSFIFFVTKSVFSGKE